MAYKNPAFALRVPAQLMEQIKELAWQKRASTNALITFILEAYIADAAISQQLHDEAAHRPGRKKH